MLASIGAMVILFGAMISLSRHVRSGSANDATKELLRLLAGAMDRYVAHNDGRPPSLSFVNFSPESSHDPAALARRAEVNNQAVVRLLKQSHVFPADSFEIFSESYYDGATVRDAWGSPIVFMPTMDPAVGMSAKGWFFFSAGPDRNYLTKSDNLYSYELGP